MSTCWITYDLGKLGYHHEVAKFSFVAPSYVSRLIGVCLFSPELANRESRLEDVQLSLLVNNEGQIPVSHTFSLGMNSIDDNHSVGQMLELNQLIEKGQYIGGYVEKLGSSTDWDTASIHLHLKFETYD